MSKRTRVAIASRIGIVAMTVASVAGWAAAPASAAASDVKINEVESNGGTPGDWIELYNAGSTPVDISGFKVLDNDNTHIPATIPPGTSLAPGGFYIVEESALGFGLGGADSARLFAADGVTIIDSYSWTAHAASTYGRCPDGSGSFSATTSTKAAANNCGPAPTTTTIPSPMGLAWPGGSGVAVADPANALGGNVSGLTYEGSGTAAAGTLWAARNGPGSIYRLLNVGGTWQSDTANGWGAGKGLRYPDGTGEPDAEGITMGGLSSAAGLFVGAERNNAANSVSRNSILRFDANAAGATLTGTNEWNLTADLPTTGANLGIEAVTWIPDSYLTGQSFLDETTAAAYNPATYPNHGSGLFLVGLESQPSLYLYALDLTGSGFTRIATIGSGFAGVMALEFDHDLQQLWVVCDDGCTGRGSTFGVNSTTGKFAKVSTFERPTGMANLNNEGFAVAPNSECAAGVKPVFWSDDANTGGNAIRSGTVTCTSTGAPEPVVPEFPLGVLSLVAGLVPLALWTITACGLGVASPPDLHRSAILNVPTRGKSRA